MPRVLAIAIALLATGASTRDAAGRTAPSSVTTSVAVSVAGDAGVARAVFAAQSLNPDRDPWARHYLHVFISFGLTWLLIIGYLVAVGRRFDRVEEEARRLREEG